MFYSDFLCYLYRKQLFAIATEYSTITNIFNIETNNTNGILDCKLQENFLFVCY